ncbi:MAG: hypothetical protein ACLTYN_13530 [Dysosmobacter welbionis]
MTYELRKTDENVLIAEGASVTGDVRLAKGVSIWYGAVLRGIWAPSPWERTPIFRTGPSSTRRRWWAGAAPSATGPSSTAAQWGTTP